MNLLASVFDLGIAQGEALLVLLHGGGQHFAGDFEEVLVETAHEHDRPFGEAGVFGDERFVFDQLELGGLGGGVGCFADGGHAGGGVEHHLVGDELGFVVSERLDLEWGVAMEAVAARGRGRP